ncbi:LysR family transcriptional regulator [Rhizorhabdus dicambivorans]|uniref:LysR family transcriptional regulator n=1 Tax=Rhizorhabdus dicambivorans TaxID=1850238 RepID=A0A2A4FRG9_9SPHN|nr:LysR family transcriptional regulator [Rhizorhabdus dicambivorans]ATE64706.1 LysR family transcriptional regulator [Rhizorhabdus dicambivorans]PCE40001.1 LysR family transcriptional regulator [Rhizorhabdus dicambivorans]
MNDGALFQQFVQIAEHRSFTVAARKLNVAQPWLSARMRRLERQLGYALFTRTTRRVELTEQGEQLLPKAKAIVAALREFRETARALGSAPSALRLGAPPYAGQLEITRRLLTRFRTQATGFRLDLNVGWSRDLLEKFARDDLDASLVLGPWPDEGFERLDLKASGLEIEMHVSDPLAGRQLTPADLAGRDIRVFTRSLNPMLFDHLFGEIAACGGRLIETGSFWSQDEPADDDSHALIGFCTIFWQRMAAEGRIRRPVDGVAPVAFSLVRRQQHLAALDALWAIAQTLVADDPTVGGEDTPEAAVQD